MGLYAHIQDDRYIHTAKAKAKISTHTHTHTDTQSSSKIMSDQFVY